MTGYRIVTHRWQRTRCSITASHQRLSLSICPSFTKRQGNLCMTCRLRQTFKRRYAYPFTINLSRRIGSCHHVLKIAQSVAGYFADQPHSPNKETIMTDIIDTANDVAQQVVERAIANAPKFNGPSLAECQDCGDHIPLQRQQLGSVTRCIDCQQYFDKKQRSYRR